MDNPTAQEVAEARWWLQEHIQVIVVTMPALPLASDALAPRGDDGQVIGGGW